MCDTRVDVIALPTEELADRLRAWAAGWYPAEAAVELLAAHRTWLIRREFLAACVRLTDGWGRDTRVPMAVVDWPRAARLLDDGALIGSSSELQILAAAVSLAGEEVSAYDLGNLVPGLDTTNVTLLLDAVAHAAGWHQRHMEATITGRCDAVEQS